MPGTIYCEEAIMVEKRLRNEQGKALTLLGHPVTVAPDMPPIRMRDIRLGSEELTLDVILTGCASDECVAKEIELDGEPTEATMHGMRQGNQESTGQV